MRKVLKKFGAPEDLVLSIDEPTMGASAELMARCDLVVATGGGGLVKSGLFLRHAGLRRGCGQRGGDRGRDRRTGGRL